MPDYSILIVTYNSEKELPRLLQSLVKFSYSNIYVCDAASTDNTVAILETHFDSKNLLKKPFLEGFSKNNNDLIRHFNLNSDYYFVLNPDTFFEMDIVTPMIRFCEENKEYAIVTPQLLYPSGAIQKSWKVFPNFFQVFLKRLGIIGIEREQLQAAGDIDWCLAAGILISAKFIQERGFLFDERYRLYCEDIDICLDAHLRGYKVYAMENVFLYHALGEKSSKNIFSKYNYWNIQSIIRFFLKWNFRYFNYIYSSRKNKSTTSALAPVPKTRLAIIGTRGIPNHYGGFEQFAEYLSGALVNQWFEVTVYNSHNHPYQEKEWRGVRIIHKFDPEHLIGTAGQFVYDLNCILDTRKRKYDVILQLGYTSSSIWGFLLPKKAVIITNMDGMEWKRSKFNKNVQSFLQWAEKNAVATSDYLIADSIGIQNYLIEKYQVPSEFIAYGAHVFNEPNAKVLDMFSLVEQKYNMLIARLEPENSIEIILDGVAMASTKDVFLVIGNHQTPYGSYLKTKYKAQPHIKFLGAIYDITILNNLRFYSNSYFHGHSVGGTNPSLLEAMASNAFICAHKNIFNEAILGADAAYFTDVTTVKELLENRKKSDPEVQTFIKNNLSKIESVYSWAIINKQYIDFINSCKKTKTISI
jgi:GT2 family glycosyltransferase/glycosyltransferase involved in cell wall biosynthesis